MSTKKNSKKNSDSLKHLDYDTVNAGAATDSTGLIPAKPRSDAEIESYQDLYSYQASRDDKTDNKL